ncbi:MAG: hypothetical protein WAV95_15900 [Azonexus sp.]
MDAAFQFWGIILVAYAIRSGLYAVADAIQNREVDVKFSAPIEVIHRSENGPSS